MRRGLEPFFVAAVTGIDDDRAEANRGREVRQRRRIGRGGRRRGRRRRRGRGRRETGHVDHDAAGATVARQIRRPIRPELRSEIDDDRCRIAKANRLNQVLCRGNRQDRVQALGLEFDDEAITFGGDGVRRLRSHVEREARERPDQFDIAGDPRDASVPDEHQPRRFPNFDTRAQGRTNARVTKSTGTNQLRPSRAGGAGSAISRPPTDARL